MSSKITSLLPSLAASLALSLAMVPRAHAGEAPTVEDTPAIEAGFAATSIAPATRWVPLAGYGGRGLIPYHQTGDAVMARVMLLRSGDVTTGVVALDLIGVQRTLLEALRARPFPERVTLSVDDLVLCASHTHHSFGGLAQRTGALYLDALFLVTCGPFQRAYFDRLVDQIWNAVVVAWDDLAPAQIGVVAEPVPGLSRNRGRSGGVTDPEIGVIKVTDPSGRIRGLVVNFAAHPVLLGAENFKASAGFPGVASRELEDRFPGAVALFTQGAGGDQSPRVPSGDHATPYDRLVATGHRLADEVARIQETMPMQGRVALSSRALEVALPSPTSFHDRLGARRTGLFRQLVIGDAILMTVPGEPCAQIGLDLKEGMRELGFRVPLVIGLAQDHIGYFVHALDYSETLAGSHGYEKGLNFYGAAIGSFFSRVHEDDFAPVPLGGESARR